MPKEAAFPRGCPGGGQSLGFPQEWPQESRARLLVFPNRGTGDLNECPCHLAKPATHRRLCRWLHVMCSELEGANLEFWPKVSKPVSQKPIGEVLRSRLS